MLAAREALGLFSFLAGDFEDGEGASRGDFCGERSELISMLRRDSRSDCSETTANERLPINCAALRWEV